MKLLGIMNVDCDVIGRLIEKWEYNFYILIV
jgi:hypothetical protein